MDDEPRITDEDRRQYERWMRTARRWAQSKLHRRRVKWAKRIVDEVCRKSEAPYLSWSAGKDSTVLVHLVAEEMGLDVPAMSLVTDLEPPNTVPYMRRWAAEWGLGLEVVEPDVSFKGWLREHADEVDLSEKVATGGKYIGGIWDDTLREWQESSPYDACLWGIRNDESKGREANFNARGAVYRTADGLLRGAPLAGWEGKDIYAYVAARDDIELMDLYQCVRLHDHPKRVRKAMYLPDDKGGRTHEGATWLRTYYPSLYRELCDILPQVEAMA